MRRREERNEDGGLGVAEAHVELEDARRALVDHEAGEEDAAEGRPFLAHPAERGHDDGAHHPLFDLAGHDRRRRVRAHPAGVRAEVAVEDPLVVLRGDERDGVRPVADDVEARLFPREHLLDDHDVSRGPELAAPHESRDSLAGLVRVARDHHALAGREPVGLHHQRACGFLGVARGLVGVAEDPILGGRNAMARQEALHERLGSLERGGGARRAERADAAGLERVDEAEDQRRLGPHDDEIDALAVGQGHEARHVVGADGGVAELAPRAGVAGRHHDLVPRSADGLGQRVFARARTDDQHPAAHGCEVSPCARPAGASHPWYALAVAEEPRPPFAIRITRPYDTEDEFLAKELDTLSRTSVTLLGAQQRPQGVVLRFELALASGAPLVRGEGRVLTFKENALDGAPGLILRFTRLDSKSKSLVDRAAALREARVRPSVLPPGTSSVRPPTVRPPPARPLSDGGPVLTPSPPIVLSPSPAPRRDESEPTLALDLESTHAEVPRSKRSERPAPNSRPPSVRPPPLPRVAIPGPPLLPERELEATRAEAPSAKRSERPPAPPVPVSASSAPSEPPRAKPPRDLDAPRAYAAATPPANRDAALDRLRARAQGISPAVAQEILAEGRKRRVPANA